MFVRKSLSSNGRYFLSFVKGYRVNGKSKQKTVENIGWLDELEKQYDDPISHFKEIAKQRTLEEKKKTINSIDSIKNESLELDSINRKNVGYSALKKIYRELELHTFFSEKQKKTKVQYNLNKIFSLLIFSRILYPGSKKETYEKRERFFEPFKFSLKDLYRSLDLFCTYKEEIEKWLWEHTKDTYGRDASKTFYDCTNYYFEITCNDEDLIDEEGNVLEKGYRKKGPEKNKRPDPIIEMGLLMDDSGIPLSYDLFPGNESEKTSLRPILNRTKTKYGLDRVIVVADRGLNTSDNIFYLSGKNDETCKNKDGYVYGQSVRGAAKEFKDYVLDQEGYINDPILDKDGQPVYFRAEKRNKDGELIGFEKKPAIFRHKSRTTAKEIKIMRDNKRKQKVIVYQKQMVYYSQKYAEKQKREREVALRKANELIKNPAKYNRDTHYGACAYINNVNFNKETGEIAEGCVLSLNEEKVAEEAKYDGYYSIVTSETGMDDQEIRNVYRGLSRIEDTFKVTKSNLESRPVYVWSKEHIEAHFLTCFVSLVIIRLLEKRLNNKYSVDRIIESLKKCSCSYLNENYYLFDYYDEILKDIDTEFKTDFSMKFNTRKNIRKFLNY